MDPEFEPSYCNRIITYAEMGQHDMAEQMFYLAQQIDEECPLCYYNIGNSLASRTVQEGRPLLASHGGTGADAPPDQLPHRPGLLVRRGP